MATKTEKPEIAPDPIQTEYETIFADTAGIEKLEKEIADVTKAHERLVKSKTNGKPEAVAAAINRLFSGTLETKTAPMREALATLYHERDNKLDELAPSITHRALGGPLRVMCKKSTADMVDLLQGTNVNPGAYCIALLEPIRATFARLGYSAKIIKQGEHNFALYADTYPWMYDVVIRIRDREYVQSRSAAILADVKAVFKLDNGVSLSLLFPNVSEAELAAARAEIVK